MISIHYFAGLKEVTGKPEEKLDCDKLTVRELKDWGIKIYPAFSNFVMYVAVNEEYALDADMIYANDVVAFIPPVSGG